METISFFCHCQQSLAYATGCWHEATIIKPTPTSCNKKAAAALKQMVIYRLKLVLAMEICDISHNGHLLTVLLSSYILSNDKPISVFIFMYLAITGHKSTVIKPTCQSTWINSVRIKQKQIFLLLNSYSHIFY